MADPYRVTDDWQEGYDAGYASGFEAGVRQTASLGGRTPASVTRQNFLKPKPKRKQSKKQKILTAMAKKAWDKYKKGSGKKTYIDIRAQVSKSAKYKKETKGM